MKYFLQETHRVVAHQLAISETPTCAEGSQLFSQAPSQMQSVSRHAHTLPAADGRHCGDEEHPRSSRKYCLQRTQCVAAHHAANSETPRCVEGSQRFSQLASQVQVSSTQQHIVAGGA